MGGAAGKANGSAMLRVENLMYSIFSQKRGHYRKMLAMKNQTLALATYRK